MQIYIIFFVISLLLVLHHAYIHPDYKGLDRYFQMSDIGFSKRTVGSKGPLGNFKTFNHEMFVILFFILGMISLWGNLRFPL